VERLAVMKRYVGAFNVCGSYYPRMTFADELWDVFYLHACKELDIEFPQARLLPEGSWSLEMIKKCQQNG
jgi:hypothetical protein